MSVPLCWIFIRRLGSVFQGPAAPSARPLPVSTALPRFRRSAGSDAIVVRFTSETSAPSGREFAAPKSELGQLRRGRRTGAWLSLLISRTQSRSSTRRACAPRNAHARCIDEAVAATNSLTHSLTLFATRVGNRGKGPQRKELEPMFMAEIRRGSTLDYSLRCARIVFFDTRLML